MEVRRPLHSTTERVMSTPAFCSRILKAKRLENEVRNYHDFEERRPLRVTVFKDEWAMPIPHSNLARPKNGDELNRLEDEQP